MASVAVENGQVVVCETHADNVFVTFLVTFHYKGESQDNVKFSELNDSLNNGNNDYCTGQIFCGI